MRLRSAAYSPRFLQLLWVGLWFSLDALSVAATLAALLEAFVVAATPAATPDVSFASTPELMDAASFWGIDRGLAPVGLGSWYRYELGQFLLHSFLSSSGYLVFSADTSCTPLLTCTVAVVR